MRPLKSNVIILIAQFEFRNRYIGYLLQAVAKQTRERLEIILSSITCYVHSDQAAIIPMT
jgi:hypothetical protein